MSRNKTSRSRILLGKLILLAILSLVVPQIAQSDETLDYCWWECDMFGCRYVCVAADGGDGAIR